MNKFSELTSKSYDIVGQKYHDLFKDELDSKTFDKDLLNSFSKLLSSSAKVIDAGCGPSGHVGKLVSDFGHIVTGIDISANCISIASNYNTNMNFTKMDMLNMDFADNSIDGIIAYYSIIHTPKNMVHSFFKEFRRVLTSKGKLLISVKSGKNEGYIDNFLDLDTSIYFSHFEKSEIEQCFTGNGFKLLSLDERAPYPDEIDVKRIFAIGEKT